MTIHVIPTLNHGIEINSVAFLAYIGKISDLRLVSFMSYTYNKYVPMYRISDGPCDGPISHAFSLPASEPN